MNNLIENINAGGSMRILAQALNRAGLTEKLGGTGPYTILAPTDAAFISTFEFTLESLFSTPRLLRALLSSHLIAAELDAAMLLEFEVIETLHGDRLLIEHDSEEGLIINGVRVIQADLRCTNGIIHVIDRTLLHKPGRRPVSAHPARFSATAACSDGAGLI